jgi:transposase-like protein
VARYGQAFKDRAVARLLPPESASLNNVALELGIAVATLELTVKHVAADAPKRPRRHDRRARNRHRTSSSVVLGSYVPAGFGCEPVVLFVSGDGLV